MTMPRNEPTSGQRVVRLICPKQPVARQREGFIVRCSHKMLPKGRVRVRHVSPEP